MNKSVSRTCFKPALQCKWHVWLVLGVPTTLEVTLCWRVGYTRLGRLAKTVTGGDRSSKKRKKILERKKNWWISLLQNRQNAENHAWAKSCRAHLWWNICFVLLKQWWKFMSMSLVCLLPVNCRSWESRCFSLLYVDHGDENSDEAIKKKVFRLICSVRWDHHWNQNGQQSLVSGVPAGSQFSWRQRLESDSLHTAWHKWKIISNTHAFEKHSLMRDKNNTIHW